MDIIEAVKKALNDLNIANEVILFGSRARGDHKKDSDWDFLILLDQPDLKSEQKEQIRERLYEIELATDQIISSIIHTKSDWERMSITPIFQVIEKEGLRA